jgi:hypothetical protein
VGTHPLKLGANTGLWPRLLQHRGNAQAADGNHRGSIFRLIAGAALWARDGVEPPTWGDKSSAPREVRDAERPFETRV